MLIKVTFVYYDEFYVKLTALSGEWLVGKPTKLGETRTHDHAFLGNLLYH